MGRRCHGTRELLSNFCSIEGSERFSTTGESSRHFVCYNRVVQSQLFTVTETQCYSHNAYFDGSSTLAHNNRAFIITVAIISGLDCTFNRVDLEVISPQTKVCI